MSEIYEDPHKCCNCGKDEGFEWRVVCDSCGAVQSKDDYIDNSHWWDTPLAATLAAVTLWSAVTLGWWVVGTINCYNQPVYGCSRRECEAFTLVSVVNSQYSAVRKLKVWR